MPQALLLTLLFALLIGNPFKMNAQKRGYEPGYIITQEGDTIHGQVKDRSPEPFVELYPRIRFRPAGKSSRQKYSPDEIRGYGAGEREYISISLREDAAFFRFRYYIDPGVEKVFLRVIRRDAPLSYYHREFVYDDNNFLDYYPLIHREGEREMVQVTQGILGLKRQQLTEYFSDCEVLVNALKTKELKDPEAVYNLYLKQCLLP